MVTTTLGTIISINYNYYSPFTDEKNGHPDRLGNLPESTQPELRPVLEVMLNTVTACKEDTFWAQPSWRSFLGWYFL